MPPHVNGAWIASHAVIDRNPALVQKGLNALYGGLNIAARRPRRRDAADRRDRRDPAGDRRLRIREHHPQAQHRPRDRRGPGAARPGSRRARRHDGHGAGRRRRSTPGSRSCRPHEARTPCGWACWPAALGAVGGAAAARARWTPNCCRRSAPWPPRSRSLLGRARIQSDLALTGLEVLTGFAAVRSRSAPLLGVLTAESRYAGRVLDPLLFFLFTIPKSIFLPLTILAMGIGFWQKIAFAVLSTFLVLTFNFAAAVRSIRAEHLLVARSYGATRRQMIWRVYIPSMLPVLLEAVRVGGHVHDHRGAAGGDVCVPHRHRPRDRHLGRKLPDAAASGRRAAGRRRRGGGQRGDPLARSASAAA